MLVPAIIYKCEIESEFKRLLYSDRLFYYNGYAPCNEIPEIGADRHDGKYEWAVVDEKHRVVGYFTYFVNTYLDTVERFGMISFDIGNCAVTLDVLAKMQELVRRHRRVTWCCIEGNPAARVYDKFLKRYQGNKSVLHDGYKSILHRCTKDEHGIYRDSYTYEILRRDF